MASVKAAIFSALQIVAGAPHSAWVLAQVIGSDPILKPNDSVSGRYIVHYSAASQRHLGVRYFNSYATLVSGGGSSGGGSSKTLSQRTASL